VFDRLGGLFERRRVLAYSAMLLAAELAVAGYFVAASYGFFTASTAPVTTDFVSFYAAGTLADAGTPELAYDRAAHYRAEQQAREPGIPYNYFYYPPVFLALCAALAKLPYVISFLIFEGVTLGLYLAAVARIAGDRSLAELIPVAAFPVVLWNFGWGQNGFLTAALVGGATLLVDRKPLTSGLLFGALCYKPHFGLLVPVALAAGRHWRAIIGAAIGTAGLAAASLLSFGMATWRAFISAALASPQTYESGGAKFSAFVTPFGAAMLVGASPQIAYSLQAAATLAALALVGLVWGRRLGLPLRAAALASATLIAVPVALFYDLLLAAVAVAWLYRSPEGLTPAERVLAAVSYLALLNSDRLAAATHAPIGPAIAGALFVCVAVRALGEIRETPARARARVAPPRVDV
jgi:alpha-1,2-mannosyltransferase